MNDDETYSIFLWSSFNAMGETKDRKKGLTIAKLNLRLLIYYSGC